MNRPSEQQVEVTKIFRKTTSNILVKAVAGSGKTTLLMLLFPLVRGKGIYLAFNNSIVDEIKKKIIPNNIQVTTLHSLGAKAIASQWGGMKLAKGKNYKFIKRASKKWDLEKVKSIEGMFYTINQLIDLARLTLSDTEDSLAIVANELAIEHKKRDLKYAMEVLEILASYNSKRPTEFDFVDMVHLPATDSRYELPRVNTVFIDEAQDLNKCQHLLVDRLRKGSRFVAVGDENQAIYAFAGADANSFRLFENKPNTIKLPLTTCYRCPNRVIDHANKVYDVMVARDDAPNGSIIKGDYIDAREGDMILCRNLRPLFQAYFDLISHKIKCYIRGEDLGENLIRIISPFIHLSKEDFNDELQGLLHEQILELSSRGFDRPMSHPTYRNLLDKIGAIRVIAKNYQTVDSMITGLKRIFSDKSETGVLLSSIHKSKGLESNNIYLLDSFLIPSKFAITKKQKIQERNLLYVAITRSKGTLTYCTTN